MQAHAHMQTHIHTTYPTYTSHLKAIPGLCVGAAEFQLDPLTGREEGGKPFGKSGAWQLKTHWPFDGIPNGVESKNDESQALYW